MEKVNMSTGKRRRVCDSKFVDGVPLNEDSLREVLSRLPIRYLYRAKCVCKQWCSVISSPGFIEMHRHRKHEPCRGLLITTADDQAQEFLFHYSPLYEQHSLLQPHDHVSVPPRFVPRFRVSYSEYQGTTQVINGLVCLYSTRRLTLLNVCTLESLELPPAPLPTPDTYTPSTLEAFFGLRPTINPINRMNTNYHFIFNAVRKVYNVLSITCICSGDCKDTCQCKKVQFVQILTIRGRVSDYKWERVSWNVPSEELQTQSFCVDRFLYWMRKIPNDPSAKAPYYFEIEEQYFAYPLFYPLFTKDLFNSQSTIVQFRGRFALVGRCHSKRRLHFYTYTHDEGNHKWDKDTIDLPRLLTGNTLLGTVIPVGNLPNRDVLLTNVRDNVRSFTAPVCSYNYETKSFRSFKVGKFPPSVASISRAELGTCITYLEEDLTPLHDILETGC